MKRSLKYVVFGTAMTALAYVMIAFAQPNANPAQPAGNAQPPLAWSAGRQLPATKDHAALGMFVGDFDQTTELWLNGKMQKTFHYVASGRWILNGRFVQVTAVPGAGEATTDESLVIYGFDPATKKYTAWELSGNCFRPLGSEGNFDEDTKTMKFQGVYAYDENGLFNLKVRRSTRVDAQGMLVGSTEVWGPGVKEFMEVAKTTWTPRAK